MEMRKTVYYCWKRIEKFDAIPKIFSNKVYSVFEEKLDSLIDVALAVNQTLNLLKRIKKGDILA
ncbi:MAG: hypothetical protein QW424_02525 [Candidatus Bathyarchaeia archaeon]